MTSLRVVGGVGGWLGVVVGAFVLCACSAPVAAGLDETEANRVVVALDRANVEALTEADPDADGRFRVMVHKGDAARALSTMLDEGLPRAPREALEAVDRSELLPSAAAEHAQIVRAAAADLETTLERIDGVVGARVHLSVPERTFDDRPPVKATASVLLEHLGGAPPIREVAVQHLIAGGVAGLLPEDVAVVSVARSSDHTSTYEIRTRGREGDVPSFVKGIIGVLAALVAALSLSTLVLYLELARRRRDQRDTRSNAT